MNHIGADKYKRKKKITIYFIILLIIAIATISRGNLVWPSLASNALTASTQISVTQPQNIQPKMDIKAIQTSLEDVLKQYQGLINSPNKGNKGKMVSELDKLYLLSANDYTNVMSLKVSSGTAQILNNLTQGSNCLTASIFEMKDSLINEGDFSSSQLKNSKEDLTLAVKSLELVKQELKS
ncbi:MAG: hypothetical protein ACYCVD_15220 [Desulfitobacteriaceae bacterium]